MRRIAATAAASANYAAITNGGGAAQYGDGGGRSNRCFDSKLTSEKSLALKAVAPLHVVVAAPPAVACTLCRRAATMAAAAASYSILARTAATDTHALSFLGLEASALWEGGAFSCAGVFMFLDHAHRLRRSSCARGLTGAC